MASCQGPVSVRVLVLGKREGGSSARIASRPPCPIQIAESELGWRWVLAPWTFSTDRRL